MSESEDKVVYEIALDLPGLAKDAVVEIPGLGTFENGGVYEVTKTEADGYRIFHTHQEPVLDEDGVILGSEAVLGRTLLQAFKNETGVDVVTAGKDQDPDDEEEEDDPLVEDDDDNEGGDQ